MVAHAQKSIRMLNLWHRCLTHLNEDDVMQMYRKGMVDGMEIIPHAEKLAAACGPCYQGKQTHKPIPKEVNSHATEPLYCIHSDLCDVGQSSQEGCRYYATFIDDYSCYTKVVPLKTKDKTLETLSPISSSFSSLTCV